MADKKTEKETDAELPKDVSRVQDVLVTFIVALIGTAVALGLYLQAGFDVVPSLSVGSGLFIWLLSAHFLITRMRLKRLIDGRLTQLSKDVKKLKNELQVTELLAEGHNELHTGQNAIEKAIRTIVGRMDQYDDRLKVLQKIGKISIAKPKREELTKQNEKLELLNSEVVKLGSQLQSYNLRYDLASQQQFSLMKAQLDVLELVVGQLSQSAGNDRAEFAQKALEAINGIRRISILPNALPANMLGALPQRDGGEALLQPLEALNHFSDGVVGDAVVFPQAGALHSGEMATAGTMPPALERPPVLSGLAGDHTGAGPERLGGTITEGSGALSGSAQSYSQGGVAQGQTHHQVPPQIQPDTQTQGLSLADMLAAKKAEMQQAGSRSGFESSTAGLQAAGDNGQLTNGSATGLLAGASGERVRSNDHSLLATVNDAIEANRVELYLQPIVGLPERELQFYEAFSRLRNEIGQLILPRDYMAVAEAAELAPIIDNQIVLRSIQVIQRLVERGKGRKVFCNLSLNSLRDADFFAEFMDFMEANRWLADHLVFEFTEEAFERSGAYEFERMASIANLGFRFSLDQITRLDIDFKALADRRFGFVKINSSLLLGNMEGSKAQIHSADLNHYLNRLNITMIVDMVEREAVVRQLRDYNVQYAQGNLFCEPKPVRPEVFGSAAEVAA